VEVEAEEQMVTQRKRYSAEFKVRMAIEALKGEKTLNELASEYGVHPTQITQWKKPFESEGPRLFAARLGKQEQAEEALKAQLYQQIGQLKVELAWLKKKAGVAHCGQARPDRAGASPDQHCSAVSAGGAATDQLGLPADRRELGEPAADALIG
jgi:transposase-like protein